MKKSKSQKIADAVLALSNNGQVVFSVQNVSQEAEFDRDITSKALRRIALRGGLEHVGRDAFRLPAGVNSKKNVQDLVQAKQGRPAQPFKQKKVMPMAPDGFSAKVHAILKENKLPGLVSGLHALRSYQNQVGAECPLLVIAEKHMGDEILFALKSNSMFALLSPGRDVIKALLESGSPENSPIIIREMDLSSYPLDLIKYDYLRRREDAWLDLVVESRANPFLPSSELALMLKGMSGSEISWKWLRRSAAHRGIKIDLDFNKAVPLRFNENSDFFIALNRELES
jgi:hypothetical protein